MAKKERTRMVVKHYKVLTPAIERVVHAAMAWQEHCDSRSVRWVRGSPPSRVMTACRALRKSRPTAAAVPLTKEQ